MAQEVFQLDNLDRKILYLLDQNSRQSSTKIAKYCHVHKNVINFRLNRLIERGIIRQFVAMISPSALGLTPYKIYLQLQSFDSVKEQKLLNFIQKLPVYWSAKVSGRWDFIIGLLLKDTKELQEIQYKLINEFGSDITTKTLSILVEAPHFSRKYLSDKPDHKVEYWLKSRETKKVDALDLKILKILAKNCRTPVVDIAKSIKATVKTIISRMRALEKRKVVYDYRISLNLEKIGYHFFKCFISLKNADQNQIKALISYCQTNPNIIHLIECVGDWELEPEFEVESFEKFQEILEEIKSKFNGIIKNVETIDIIKENDYICLPGNAWDIPL